MQVLGDVMLGVPNALCTGCTPPHFQYPSSCNDSGTAYWRRC